MQTDASLGVVEVRQITPSPFNSREFGKDSKSGLKDLAENIKQNGVINPVTVRRVMPGEPGADTTFELVAGERRWRAAKIAGLKEIPAVVRTLTDSQAADIIVSENLYREDLQPMEEAGQVKILLEAHDNDAKVVADVIGKPVAWVVKRANLVNLSAKWVKELKDEKSPVFEYTASHLELVARLPASQQDVILKDRPWQLGGLTVRDLDTVVTDQTHLLTKAPWDLTDATLSTKAGACVDCPKRSDCNPGLFDDDPDEPAKTARCLDDSCWLDKSARRMKILANELTKKDGQKPLLLKEGGDFAGAEYAAAYQSAKKTERGAIKALYVTGPKTGRTGWVKLWSSSSNPTGRTKPTKSKETLADKRARLNARRSAHVIEAVSKALEKKVEAVDMPLLDMVALVCLLGAPMAGIVDRRGKKLWAKFDSTMDKQVPALLWAYLQEELAMMMSYGRSGGTPAERTDAMMDADRVSDIIGLDFDQLMADAEVKFKEPPAWTKKKKTK